MDGGGHLVPLSYIYGYRGGVGRRGVAGDLEEDLNLLQRTASSCSRTAWCALAKLLEWPIRPSPWPQIKSVVGPEQEPARIRVIAAI